MAQPQTQVLVEALLILKWGGVLTHAGRQQSEDLGRLYRMIMYPSGGNGLLRLHSTYRHDLKIYSSDEGRVQVRLARAQSIAVIRADASRQPLIANKPPSLYGCKEAWVSYDPTVCNW